MAKSSGLEVDGLEAGRQYVFQYWVEGTIKIGDPLTAQVADPFNDRFIEEELFPNLPDYDKTEYGIASVLQTAQQEYQWQHPAPVGGGPEKENLMIYELLVRDFLGSHSYRDLTDSLDYLQRLGINTVQLMPIMEFEGNESWGYNPSYFLAVDKYYGTENDLKAFIDEAHSRGMAVVLDMVLNHAFGQNPMVRMYFDEAANKPAADNPWFNPDATHPFNVGYDFNHESQYTKNFVDTVNLYWLKEFNFDGFRFDLSKGFTQQNNPDNVGAWSAYDQSRIDLLKRMADVIWEEKEDALVILEHLAVNTEEEELAEYGMMLWGNMNHNYGDLLKGDTNTTLAGMTAAGRGWDVQHLIGYSESHDEQRQMYRLIAQGATTASINLRDTTTALERIKIGTVFTYLPPGPKMMWQFAELGYDIPINGCPPDGSVIEEGCRIANKPIPWGEPLNLNYHLDPQRQELYKVHAALFNLRNAFAEAFINGSFSWDTNGAVRTMRLSHESLNLVAVGNFGLEENTATLAAPGNWFSLFDGGEEVSFGDSEQLMLGASEVRVYIDRQTDFPEAGLIDSGLPAVTASAETIRPNEPVTFTLDLSRVEGEFDFSAPVTATVGAVTASPASRQVSQQSDEISLAPVEGEAGKFSFTITPGDLFGLSEDEVIYRLAMTFTSGSDAVTAADNEAFYFNLVAPSTVVEVVPEQFGANTAIRIIFDAAAADANGTAGLMNANQVYMHSGVVTRDIASPSGDDWRNIVGNWGQDDGIGEMQPLPGEPNKWYIDLVPSDYYGLSTGTNIYYLAMVFRSADGLAEGKAPGGGDIFIEVTEQDDPLSTTPDINNQLQLYPNPANSFAVVKWPADSSSFNATITTLGGRVVAARAEQIANGLRIDTSNLAAGMYLLQLQNQQGQAVLRLVVE